MDSPRAGSPAFLNAHSRQSSLAGKDFLNGTDDDTTQEPWEVIRWTKLRKLTGQAFSEIGKRTFGKPTCITVSALIALGTSKGLILVFDYNQERRYVIGEGTKGMAHSTGIRMMLLTANTAVESGSVTSISTSADHSTIASGHASGDIFTWDIGRSAKPFLHIPPLDRASNSDSDGHVSKVPILHVSFLGMRHTALVSADDKGMAFSHLATRGMGVVARTVKTTRILGRYPDKTPNPSHPRKPSSVLAFSPLPLGNVEHISDSIGLVAMLTPYLMVIVSTTPIAQTQYKTPRPKEIAAHGAMSAALAWYPSVKFNTQKSANAETSSKVKLVYCWSNILTILEIFEMEPSEKGASPSLQFRPRSRWKADEAIVGLQWLSRSVLAVLTITQQLILLEDSSLEVINSSDLIQKHIYHYDLFSPQLNQLVDQLDDEDTSMHGVVADAFYMSFRTYKGRIFLLGYNEVSLGTLSNWADCLLALMEQGNFIGAIQLATSYYNGKTNSVTVSLPEDDESRHKLVEAKLLEMMSASLKYAFGKNVEAGTRRVEQAQLEELATACIAACISMAELDFLFDDVYHWYQDVNMQGIFVETLEPQIMNGNIEVMPPLVIKDLVAHYMSKGLEERLEELICHLDPRTMDIDQITTLCKKNKLYDAVLYVWNQALGDYTTILTELLDQNIQSNGTQEDSGRSVAGHMVGASTIFPYLSYILTSRVYPTGREMLEEKAFIAKAEIYNLFFSGNHDRYLRSDPSQSQGSGAGKSFLNLRKILDIDASSFLSMLNEAFEDSFLNGAHNRAVEKQAGHLSDEQTFGLSINRQWIISILLEVMTPPKYEIEDTIYLNMFIARSLPKFPQFILLPGHVLHRVLVDLCKPPGEDIAEDCQLSVEYMLSMYQPPNLQSMIPLLASAKFYRVLKSIYRAENQYSKLLQTCFDDYSNSEAVFDCIGDCLRPGLGLTNDQISDVRSVITEHAHDLVAADISRAALTLDEYAPDLHGYLLEALLNDEAGQFEYLRNIYEPPSRGWTENQSSRHSPNRRFLEQYVRLLCDFDQNHVSEFVEQLGAGDLRLEEVLPSLEQSGIIDAAVVLMAREGKIREALDRLIDHLHTMEAVLLGLLDSASNNLHISNILEAAHGLVVSVQKYVRVGLWLCQGQTRSVQQRKADLKQPKRSKSKSQELSMEESLWLDLIDAVVMVTKNVTELLEETPHNGEGTEDSLTPLSSKTPSTELMRLTLDLRSTVQETFTALLATTSAPRTNQAPRTDVSFLRILGAFLNRASLSSPSLSNLRAVLRAIFSAYAYEESLLSLANRLLDKDLFIHVAELDSLRRRGWRPLGQVCEGCGRRVWGPGAGGHVWDAWQRLNDERLASQTLRDSKHAVDSRTASIAGHGKGKAAIGGHTGGSPHLIEQEAETGNNGKNLVTAVAARSGSNGTEDSFSPLVIFSCRHIFHQSCLEKMQGTNEAEGDRPETVSGGARPGFSCPLCTQH